MKTYNQEELEEILKSREYPNEFMGIHPYDHRLCKYVFVGVQEDFEDPNHDIPLYNCDSGHTLSLETIIKHQKKEVK